jgi:phthalate 4,5-dioxygenase oxygenase subunit
MGSIVDRTIEHLGTADAMIIRVRRRLIAAARALREHGTVPPGVDEPSAYAVRTMTTIQPEGVDPFTVEAGSLKAFSGKPVLSAEAQQASMRLGTSE